MSIGRQGSPSVCVFVPPAELQPGDLRLTGEEHKYLTRVRRRKVGDMVTVYDGEGRQSLGRITKIDSEGSDLTLFPPEAAAEPALHLTVAPAIIKGDRMELAITKLVELGVRQIRPMITERTIVRPTAKRADKRLERYASLCRAAARQSRNPLPTSVAPICTFSEILSIDADLKIIPTTEEPRVPIKNVLAAANLPVVVGRVLALIGPEGGFSPAEQSAASDAGFVSVSLGGSILRAETACMAVATMVGFCYGDLGG